jgi:dynein light chain LC8-type
MCDRKAVIKNADMSEEMQQDAVDCATQALEKFNIEKACSMIIINIILPITNLNKH